MDGKLVALIKALAGNVYGPASGTDNQVLRFDGTSGKRIQGTTGFTADDSGNVNATSFTGNGAGLTGVISGATDQVRLQVRKSTAGTITKGKPVYLVGYNVGGWFTVEEADAADPAKMPAVAIAEVDITNTATVQASFSGRITNQVTGSWGAGDPLYVASGGGLTNSRPTGAGVLVQRVGEVGFSNPTTGIILVVGAGRSNDVPNITKNFIWAGDTTGVAQARKFAAIPATFDSAGINAAIDSLGAKGGEVYLPAGDYDVTASITYDYDRTSIRGAGSGTRILNTGRALFDASTGTLSEGDTVTGSIGSGTAVVAAIDYTNGILWYNQRSGTDFVNNEVLSSGGNNVTVDGSPTDGVQAFNIGAKNDCELKDMLIVGGSTDGSATQIVVNGGNRPIIEDVVFDEPGGLLADLQDSVGFRFQNNNLARKDVGNTSIQIRCTSDTKLFGLVEGNVLRHTALGDVITTDTESHYLVIADNTIEGGRWPVWAQGDHAVISNNNVYNSNNAITVEGDYCVIEGNKNDSDANEGIKVTGSHCTVSDNTLFNCGKYAIMVTGSGATYCSITGNVIYDTGATYSDIIVSGSAHFASVVGNVCHGDEVGTASAYGISINSADYCLVSGNVCDNHTTAGIEVSNSTGTQVPGTNNVVAESTPFSFSSITGLQEVVLADGRTAPGATAGLAKLYVDTTDGDLKVIFGDGTIKTIVTDT